MGIYFLIAFSICLFSYIFHTITHYFEFKGRKSSKKFKILCSGIIDLGHLAFIFMIVLDPVKMNIPYALLFGLLIGILGLVLFILAVKEKKGFYELSHLIKTGVYSKSRHPMYLGLILVYVGFPLAFGSILTLLSALIWVSLILLWKYWEEKELEEKFGKEYLSYRKRTIF